MGSYLRLGHLYGGPRAWASIYDESIRREASVWEIIAPPKCESEKPLLEQIHEDRLVRWEDELKERFPAPPKDDGWDDWF